MTSVISKTLTALGWLLLGLSIFFSITVLPLCLVLAFLESAGPISSGEQGVQVPLIPVFCLLPGIVGAATLWLRHFFEKSDSHKLTKRCAILLSIQFICFVLVWLLTPTTENTYQGDFLKQKPPSPEALENLRKIIPGN